MLFQKLSEVLYFKEVKNIEDVKTFVQTYNSELDERFFIASDFHIKKATLDGKKEAAGLLTSMVETIQQIQNELLQEGRTVTNIKSTENELLALGLDLTLIFDENKTIFNLIGKDPVLAYQKAIDNLKKAQQTKSDELILYTSLTLAKAASESSPPKSEEKIQAFQLAAEKALATNNDEIYADTQYNLGNAYKKLQSGNKNVNLQQAVDCYRNALRIYTKDNFSKYYAETQVNLGSTYCDLAAIDRPELLKQAIICYQNSLSIHTKKNFPQDYARIQKQLGDTYMKLPTESLAENINKAIICYQNALQIYTKQDFPEDYASTLNSLGLVYFKLSTGDRRENLQRAIAYYNEALNIFTEDKFPENYADLQNNIGIAYKNLPTGDRRANIYQALEALQNASHIYTKEKFPQDYAIVEHNLANLYIELGSKIENREENCQKAITHFLNIVNIYVEKDFPYEYAATQHDLGQAYLNLPTEKNIQAALVCFQNALRIYTETEFPVDYAGVQRGIGMAYTFTEKTLEKAKTCYFDALRVLRIEQFPQERIKTLFLLAIFHRSSEPQLAYNFCAEAIDILETRIRSGISSKTRYALSKEHENMHNFMLALCIDLEKIDQAISYIERSKARTLVEMLHAIQLQPSQSVPQKLRDDFEKIQQRLNELHYLQQAIEPGDYENEYHISHSKFINYRSLQFNIWQQIDDIQKEYDRLLNEIRKYDSKFIACEQVQSISLNEIRRLIPKNTVFIECFTGKQGTYVFVLNGNDSKEEMPFYLHLKELTSDDVLHHWIIEQWYSHYYAEPDIRLMFYRLKIYLLANFENSVSPEILQRNKDFLIQFMQNARSNLEKWCEYLEIDLCRELQRIEQAFVAERLHEVAEILFSLDTDFLLHRLKEGWYKTIEDISYWLAEKFWYAKAENSYTLAEFVKKSKAEQIVFIPHKWLNLLPLHLIPLQTQTCPNYKRSRGLRLIDKYQIAYTPSVELLRLVSDFYKRLDLVSLFAVIDPDQTLPFAGSEVHGITMHFENQNSQILWHKQATKETILNQPIKANIIHFCCHGKFEYWNPMESHLVLAQNKNRQNDKENNLTLQEIFAQLKLPKANAVVLSACETGMTKLGYGGEYIGLPSGFMYAGSPTVISSLWAVNDLSTSILMNRWYENVLQKRMNKASALREAQLWVRDLTNIELVEYLAQPSIEQYINYESFRAYKRAAKRNPEKQPFEHPYYWGAFTCNGSWE